MSSYFAPVALLPGGVARDVRLDVTDGRYSAVTPGADPGDATRLPGVVLPGFANNHSHAFHRALRGRTHDGGGTFWTWRDRMYALSARLDPDSYLRLARAVYAEMALCGVTTVGEFHYLHHGPGGKPYADPNEMAEALRQAAKDAGIRLTLLDTCYLAGGLGSGGFDPPSEPQRRFADADVEAWAHRVERLSESDGMRVGVAAHSVRAVPEEAFPTIVGTAHGRPLHIHLSEQPAENWACFAHYGASPTVVLGDVGFLGPSTTVVHATHLEPGDATLLGRSGCTACLCPTTERDLADGIGPARALLDAQVALSLGSDQNAVVDLFEEARGLEMHERLGSRERGRFAPEQLLTALTRHGALGWDDAGALAVGQRADLVAVRDDTVRTAGADPAQLLLAATAADVEVVVVDGRTVVSGGQHVLGDVGRLLHEAIAPLWAT